MNPVVVELQDKKGQPKNKVKCAFCDKSEIDSLMWGPMYQLEGVTVHYFCLLFSAGLSQNGEDEEGILGFLPKDIRKELNRGKKLKCKYCKGVRATVGCSVKSCKVSFHYPCGLDEGSSFQFIGNYESYCVKHRTTTPIDIPREKWECPICYGSENFSEEKFPIKSPCCNNNAVFHRKCMMEMARSSGLHYFRCPLCNSKEAFSEAMRLGGIYVPDRDCTWELEPNAYSELNQQYNQCDIQPCICPHGRQFNHDAQSQNSQEIADWKIVRCGGCGAAGAHMKCAHLENLTYRCELCKEVLQGSRCLDDSVESEGFSPRRRGDVSHSQETRINRQQYDSDSSDEGAPTRNVFDILRPISLDVDESSRSSSTSAETEDETDDSVSVSSRSSDLDLDTTPTTMQEGFHRHQTIHGRKYIPVEFDSDDNEYSDDDYEDEEEVEEFTTPTQESGVSNFRKLRAGWKTAFRCYSMFDKYDQENRRSDTRSQLYKSIDAYLTHKERLDKLRIGKLYNGQMSVTENPDSVGGNDNNQIRAGLVEVSKNSSDVLNVISQVPRPVQRDRTLRSQGYYPNLRSNDAAPVTSEVQKSMDKLQELFNKRIAKTKTPPLPEIPIPKNTSSLSSSSQNRLSNRKVPEPNLLIEKVVGKFTEAYITITGGTGPSSAGILAPPKLNASSLEPECSTNSPLLILENPFFPKNARSSSIGQNNSIVLSDSIDWEDDNDDCIVVAEQPKPKPVPKVTIEIENDDDIIIEEVKINKPYKKTEEICSDPGIQWNQNIAPAYRRFAERYCPQELPKPKYFNGKTSHMSQALLAKTNFSRKPKPIIDTKTNSGSDLIVVILDSDEEEEANATSNPLPTSSTSKDLSDNTNTSTTRENTSFPKPNREPPDQLGSTSKRLRDISGAEDTECGVNQSKRHRIS